MALANVLLSNDLASSGFIASHDKVRPLCFPVIHLCHERDYLPCPTSLSSVPSHGQAPSLLLLLTPRHFYPSNPYFFFRLLTRSTYFFCASSGFTPSSTSFFQAFFLALPFAQSATHSSTPSPSTRK